jgi:hypothetical protein
LIPVTRGRINSPTATTSPISLDTQRHNIKNVHPVLVLYLSAALMGLVAGATATYQYRSRGHERFHLGSWVAFLLCFSIIVLLASWSSSAVRSPFISEHALLGSSALGLVALVVAGASVNHILKRCAKNDA